jgi:hypothetical protein
LLILQDRSSVAGYIFPEFARPAEKWRLALQDPSMKYGRLNRRRKTDSIFLVDADFLYDKAPRTDVMLQKCD